MIYNTYTLIYSNMENIIDIIDLNVVKKGKKKINIRKVTKNYMKVIL